MEKEDAIYLDKKGYENYLKEIEEIKLKLSNVNSGRKDAFEASAGDGWDSPEFEEIERQERMIMGELQRKYEALKRIVVIEKHNEEDVIDIGDTLITEIVFSDEDSEELIFTLVGFDGNIKADIQEISINSPLGKSVYKKKIGDTCSYNVNGNNISVIVKEKMDLETEKNKDNQAKKLSR